VSKYSATVVFDYKNCYVMLSATC